MVSHRVLLIVLPHIVHVCYTFSGIYETNKVSSNLCDL